MIKQDFERFHNSASEAINAAWCLGWSILAAVFHGLCHSCIWMRSLAHKQEPAWVSLAMFEPVKLKFESKKENHA